MSDYEEFGDECGYWEDDLADETSARRGPSPPPGARIPIGYTPPRRGGRAVECASFENWCARKGTGGSNPPLSARSMQARPVMRRAGFFYSDLINASLV